LTGCEGKSEADEASNDAEWVIQVSMDESHSLLRATQMPRITTSMEEDDILI
jgi:hypothetical protein